jgi:phosphate transport system substrate-binding protein
MFIQNNRRVIGSLTAVAVFAIVPSRGQAETIIKIDGSTGTAPLVRALGKAFTAKRGITVEVGKGLGTKARLAALADGKIDIAMASHGLKVDAVTKQGMTVHRIAMTPVIFGVHQTVKIRGLGEADVCNIYAGGQRNWKALGGPDLAIVPLTRPDTEVDMEIVRDGLGCFKILKLRAGINVLKRAGDMAKALAETTGGIGMTSTTVAAQSRGKIKAIMLNGAEPNEANVAAGQYRLTRDAFLIVGKTPSASAQAFVAFVRNAEGAALIRANGAIPETK